MYCDTIESEENALYRYGILTDTNEYYRVDDKTGIPYKYDGKSWVKDFDLLGTYSGDIPSKPIKEEEVWKKLGLQK